MPRAAGSLLKVGMLIDDHIAGTYGEKFFEEVFRESNAAYISECCEGNLSDDLRANGIRALLVLGRGAIDIQIFKKAGIDVNAVVELPANILGRPEHARALILSYLEALRHLWPIYSGHGPARVPRDGTVVPVLNGRVRVEKESRWTAANCPRGIVKVTDQGPIVDSPDDCEGCGYCSGTSMLGYLEMPNFTTEYFVAFLNALVRHAPREPGVILFTCKRALPGLEPTIAGVEIYPLLTPCIASVSDSFLVASLAAGFHPFVLCPDGGCRLRELALRRVDGMLRGFPGAGIEFPSFGNLAELKAYMQGAATTYVATGRRVVPEEVVTSRSRRRALFAWAAEAMEPFLDLDDEVQGVFLPRVDADKCVMCGNCAKVCPTRAFHMVRVNDELVLRENAAYCIGCGLCVRICPERAITLKKYAKAKDLHYIDVKRDRLLRCQICGAPVEPESMIRRINWLLEKSGHPAQYTVLCEKCRSMPDAGRSKLKDSAATDHHTAANL
jgi:ferredoxin